MPQVITSEMVRIVCLISGVRVGQRVESRIVGVSQKESSVLKKAPAG
jgi:hypothetical protein